ncbi:MAG: DUF1553 domain-containing protein, partial [Mucilaginibacter polytrichastri]|nr:DUF1553 domain-containing protein [Mucilaginibacter polytrichastri]
IIPGDPKHSEFIRRLTLDDPEERMPYKHEPLSKEEIDLLTSWVKQGAKWGEHWAYVPVKEPEIPGGHQAFFTRIFSAKDDWSLNAIDKYIRAKQRENKVEPAAEADKQILLRRLSLDLTGMPASPRLAERFLQDKRPQAYEVLVDSLLASPHYGERWTAMWLDLARYADTKGYERDDGRNIWRYRDWLINAFNRDEPYNRFLTEQLAGDLLPDPDEADFIATAFHRNTMTNDEGGTDNEEFRIAAVMDRVSTTWETLMGTTFACVQCHAHPYDPFRHEDYYKFMAFFNDTRDEDTEGDYPLYRSFAEPDKEKMTQLRSWLQQNTSAGDATRVTRFLQTWQPSINSLTADHFVNAELNDTKWLAMRYKGVARLAKVDLTHANELTVRLGEINKKGFVSLRLDRQDGPELLKIIPDKNDPNTGWAIRQIRFAEVRGVHDIWIVYENPSLKNTSDNNGIMFDWLHFAPEFPGKGKPGYEAAWKQYDDLLRANTEGTPIMMDNPKSMHRLTQVFERGNWLVKGARVHPDVPQALNAFPKNAPRNRLGLAMWLTDKKNPLTARTMVNRLWEQIFGTGLVETLEDMGTQGTVPTHRELLDYLAYRLMYTHNWSVKKTLKEIVMSATYRQSAIAAKDMLAKDPANTWYARGARVRLSAEQIRDQALVVSGLLNPQIGGPSVMPYQPDGVWLSPWNGQNWEKSAGNQQYRRAIYTYWKRTAAYPSMLTFDGVSREVCSPRRIRTNTPLQALVTLNDEVYMEAARHLAGRAMQAVPADVAGQIRWCYAQVMGKAIRPDQLAVFAGLYQKIQGEKGTAAHVSLASNREPQVQQGLVMVASAMLNMDEFITKN